MLGLRHAGNEAAVAMRREEASGCNSTEMVNGRLDVALCLLECIVAEAKEMEATPPEEKRQTTGDKHVHITSVPPVPQPSVMKLSCKGSWLRQRTCNQRRCLCDIARIGVNHLEAHD